MFPVVAKASFIEWEIDTFILGAALAFDMPEIPPPTESSEEEALLQAAYAGALWAGCKTVMQSAFGVPNRPQPDTCKLALL